MLLFFFFKTCYLYPDPILVAFSMFKAWRGDNSNVIGCQNNRMTLRNQYCTSQKRYSSRSPGKSVPLIFCRYSFHFTVALSFRSHESGQLEDVKWSIRCLRFLLNQSLNNEAFNLWVEGVTGTLAMLLTLQTELEPGATIQDIEEMAVHCQELLNSDISKTLLIAHTMALVSAVDACARKGMEGRAHSEKVIECLREANRSLPDLHKVSITLAECLYSRFEMTFSNDDHEEGMAILDSIIAFRLPQNQSSQFLQDALELVALFAASQLVWCGRPEYLEKEIHRFRNLLTGASPEDPVRPVIVKQLSKLRGLRRNDFDVTARFRDAHSIDSAPVPPFRDLIMSLSQSRGGSSSGSEVANDLPLDPFLLARHLSDVSDIEPAIEYYRLVLASYHPSSRTAFRAGWSLGDVLRTAFSLTNNVDYLDESITVHRDLLASMVQSQQHFTVAVSLAYCLYIRFCWLHHRKDLDDSMRLYHVVVHNQSANIQDRFEMSCIWAHVAHNHVHPSVSAAYDCAMSHIQDSLTFAPTLDTQHFRLVTMRRHYEVLPLNYASYLVHTGQLHQAIEILEQGRALLWSEMRGLRTPLDQLRAADSHLADKVAALNRNLETMMLTISLTGNDDGDDSIERIDRIGLLLLQQRKLLDERDTLFSQVRTLPGFETFLMTPSFDNLRLATLHGPVVIINHSKRRSDILILLHNAPPSLITTSDDFYDRAIDLRDRLMKCRTSRGHVLDSKQYEHDLRSVLVGLYDLVGRPVIERLRSLNVSEQSRVWWCPTSVFCSLPLHAMGPIPSEDGLKRHFFDLYIPSYTPTLSALIESRKPSNEKFEKPSILLVAQPDQSLLSTITEISVMNRLDTKVTTLKSSDAIPSAVMESLRDHQFLHFACHGKLEDGKPFDASFQLHDGKRLTLLELIHSQLPTAEFAFLSACHTAEITEGSIADEALHLTAAMQYCGFRSVVGTMWGMADADGPELVEHFYKSMFSSKQAGIPYYERSARALRAAVRRLRKNRVPLERWVNFVHYGA
ncbi:CHAT domain-containing protein [Russula earlei]|uniref:CHAT domain-containing protein n=1 Tax=Russula earlei TaxID=71964 RepID=A0ACC0UHE6_9AGAM|nr:CHAT domain-containing protein [Russula earlei]